MTLHETAIFLIGVNAGVLLMVGIVMVMDRKPPMPPISRRLEREIAELTKHL